MRLVAGFTVLELFYVIALTALLIGIGAPTFTQLALDSRMSDQVNRFVHAVHAGRHAAQVRMTEIALCGSRDGLSCTGASGREWDNGWILFANRDRDYPPQRDTGEKLLLTGDAWATGRIRANRRAFVFRPFEIRSTNGTVTFCDRRGPRFGRAVILSYTGRPRTVRGVRPSDCPA